MRSLIVNPILKKNLNKILHFTTFSLVFGNILGCTGICFQLGYFDYTVFFFSIGFSVLDYYHLSKSKKNMTTFNEEKIFKRTIWVSLFHVYLIVMFIFFDSLLSKIVGIIDAVLIIIQYVYTWRFQIQVERQNYQFRHNARESLSKGDVDKFVYSISDNFEEWENKTKESDNKKQQLEDIK
ncbi:hypothetical protein [Candidatus Lokiarchaeum ossiferum]|uniref:hypothetical protein n=1 Tax=Candidatus Lokiarchaeum ossiferum TaxID=2951803 RepID=UPI00352ECA07